MTPSLGTIIKRLRRERGWKLADMSLAVGIPLSTLSKIENDKLTLSYDKLQQLAKSLNIPLTALFAEPENKDGPSQIVTGRRSIATLDRAIKVSTENYEYSYFCSELRHRRMIPIHTRVTARTLAEFGDLVRHSGEEFAYVIEGAVELHSEFYEPVLLHKGEGVYIDSMMGHAYLVPPGHDEAVMLVICASGDEHLQEELIAEASTRLPAGKSAKAPDGTPRSRAPKPAKAKKKISPSRNLSQRKIPR